MSKRKADQITPSETPRLSAFAAARARSQEQQSAWNARSQAPSDDDSDSDVEPGHTEHLQDAAEILASRANGTTRQPYNIARLQDDWAHFELPQHTYLDDPLLEYDTDGDVAEPPKQPVPPNHRNRLLCTWQPTDKNVLANNETDVLLKLDTHQTLCLIGQYDLCVKLGQITIYGATLCAGSSLYRVFAPSTHALPIIECVSPHGAHLEIYHVQPNMRILKKLSPLFGRIWNYRVKERQADLGAKDHRSFSWCDSGSKDPFKRPLLPLEISKAWQESLDKLAQPQADEPAPMIMLCGPQGAGKSTFSRILANKLLTFRKNQVGNDGWRNPPTYNAVYYLDLDPGQAELSPAGQVTLVLLRQPVFGPPYTHPTTGIVSANRTIRAHSIASNRPSDFPEHFIACAVDLMDTFRRLQFQSKDVLVAPLVINCPAWYPHSGTEIIAALIKKLRGVTQIVSLSSPSAQIAQQLAAVAQPMPFHLVDPQPNQQVAPLRTGAELREMQMLSLFHQDEVEGGHLQWDAFPLTSMKPYDLSYDPDPQRRTFLGVLSLGELPDPELLHTILNATIAAVVYIDDMSALDGYKIRRGPADYIPYFDGGVAGFTRALDPRKTRLIGLVLIRGIDWVHMRFQVLTPIPEAVLGELDGNRTVIVRGHFDLPGFAVKEDIYVEEHMERQRDKRFSHDTGSGPPPEREWPWVRKVGPNDHMSLLSIKMRSRRFRSEMGDD